MVGTSDPRRPLVLRNGTALVGAELQARPFGTMSVVDGRVAAIDEPVPAGATEVELDGRWVVPGLVDAHVHLELTAAAAPFDQWDAPVPDRMVSLVRNGLAALASGTLTVRDLGSVDHSVIGYGRLTDGGRVLGPRVFAAGQMIAMTGGHLWRHARQADGPDDVRRAVREQIRGGATVIKLMATGGLTTPGDPGSPELGEDELAAAVREARNAGVPVAAHAHGAEGVHAAISAGVTTIEHGGLIGPAECERLVETGVALVPTLSPILRLPSGDGVDPDVQAKTAAIRSDYVRNIAGAIRSGVRVVAGTDAGCAFNPIGAVAHEVAHYVALGLSPADALRSCTVWAGEVLGADGVGVIEPGGRADLVVVDADPRHDITTLAAPSSVVRGGRYCSVPWLESVIDALGGRDQSRPALDALGLLEEDGAHDR